MTKAENENYIICNGVKVLIEWSKVINILDDNALILDPPKNRTRQSSEITQFICHHDAALSAKSCWSILKRRNLSVQFSIDNDGTIYQHMDSIGVAQHAGHSNQRSVGVEISNAVEKKYAYLYPKAGFAVKKTAAEKINGHWRSGTLFYPVQIEALKALIAAVCPFYGIPRKVPINKPGAEIKKIYTPAVDGSFHGIIAHYHVSKNKWDPFGLDLRTIVT